MATAPAPAYGLILILPPAPGDPWRFRRVGDQGVGAEEYATELPEHGSLTVLVPAAQAPVVDKPLP
ncbi:MAG: hypothetical protein ACK4Z8_17210, partial [Novosphingobium sp.]